MAVVLDSRDVAGAPMAMRWIFAALATGGAVALGLGNLWECARRPGKVAVDGTHSEWEWVDVPVDKHLFGTKTTYNYRGMLNLIEQYFGEVEVLDEGRITPQRLADINVLMLKTPTQPFAEDEVQAIIDFVAGGGGLWLIGDHTNIFGMNTYLNAVANPLGMEFHADAAFYGSDKEQRDVWIKRQGGGHSITAGLDRFAFMTSCTISASWPGTESVLVGDDYYADAPDYSKVTFFGDHEIDAIEPFGSFLQCCAREFGAGRVVAFGDSTVFSTFEVFVPGKPELVVGTMDWLTMRRSMHWAGSAVAIVGIVSGLLLLMAAHGQRWSMARWIGCGALLVPAMGAHWMSPPATPAPRWTLERVAVVSDLENAFGEREYINHQQLDSHAFKNLLVCVARAGYLPVVMEVGDTRLSECAACIVVGPAPEHSVATAAWLRPYLRGGGKVWIGSEDERPVAAVIDSLPGGQSSLSTAELPTDLAGFEAVRFKGCFDWLRAEVPETRARVDVPLPRYFLTGERSCVVLGCPDDPGEQKRAVWVEGMGGRLAICAVPAVLSDVGLGLPVDVPTEGAYEVMELLWTFLAGE